MTRTSQRRAGKHHPLDHAAKEIVRLAPDLVPRLLGLQVGERSLRFADSSVRSREHRADQVLLIGEDNDPEAFGWHLEFQAGDDRREFMRWTQKNAALNEQLKRPIVLMILYLLPGGAPYSFEVEGGGVRNRHEYAGLRLWEYADSVRCGALPELAPFLILWNDKPDERALREQRELLLKAPLAPEIVDDLLGWTVVVGSRFFPNEVLRTVFDKELEMLKEFPEVKRWIQEGREEGRYAGVAEGGLATARRICKEALTEKFGPLSPAAAAYLDTRTADELSELVVKAIQATDLAALGIPV